MLVTRIALTYDLEFPQEEKLVAQNRRYTVDMVDSLALHTPPFWVSFKPRTDRKA